MTSRGRPVGDDDMSEAAMQAWLPNVEEPSRRSGIYPAQWYQGAFQRKEIVTAVPLVEVQLQPASLDLRLGATAYRVPASFLPGRKHGVDDKLAWLKELKEVRRGRISEYAEKFRCTYHEGERPWSVGCDLAFPCATQNEISQSDVGTLIANGCQAVSEGANMPTEQDGIHDFVAAKVLFAPSKAANAGGVAISGLEMSQNSARITWKEEELQTLLREIMGDIHERCVEYGKTDDDYIDYVKGANIAGFIKVADAMVAYGVV